MKGSDVRVNTENFKETEEHLGFLCGFMRYLIEKENVELAKEVFLFSQKAFLGWVDELKARSDAKFYLALALIAESFMKFEMEFYS